MGERRPIKADTIAAVAAENAGHPLDKARAAAYAEAFEPILQQLEALRRLPLKDVEPAVIFQPVEVAKDD